MRTHATQSNGKEEVIRNHDARSGSSKGCIGKNTEIDERMNHVFERDLFGTTLLGGLYCVTTVTDLASAEAQAGPLIPPLPHLIRIRPSQPRHGA